MLTTIAAIAIFAAPQQTSGAQIISGMLKYYADAKTLTGTIKLVAYSGGGQAELDTTIQFEKPAKLYIRQVKGGAEPEQWVVVSDGDHFGYDTPNEFPGSRKRLFENVQQNKEFYDFKRIYALAAASSLGDRSLPLDFVISRREDLEHDSLMLVSVNDDGKTEFNKEQVNSVSGDWRAYGRAPVSGKYQMLIAEDGRLLRYILDQYIAVPNAQPQEVKFVWDVNVKVNGTPDPALWRVQ